MDEYKILVIGDPHLKISNLDIIKRLTKEIVALIKLERPERVIVLGDLHDSHEKLNVYAWLASIEFLTTIRNEALHVGADTNYILGNHDIPSNNLFLEKIHPYVYSEDFTGDVVDYPIEISTRIGKFALIPYVPPGRFVEALNLINKDPGDFRTIFCHQEFKNADYGQSFISKDGDEWSIAAPLVVSGHIHKYQWLQTNILYVGSPYQVNFGEVEEKTVSLLTYTKDSVKVKNITLDMPRKRTFTTSLSDLQNIEFFDKDENRLIIEDTSTNILKFKASEVYKQVQSVAKVIFKPTDKVFIKRSVNKKTFLDILRDSVEKEDVSVKEVFSEVVRAVNS